MGILVFGTGKYYETYRFWLEQLEIVALLDNDRSKQTLGRLDGHLVLPPASGIKLDYKYIYVLGKYAQDMREELLELGVKTESIRTIDNLIDDVLFIRGKLKLQIFKVPGIENNSGTIEDVIKFGGKNILLVSHSLGLSGAVVACHSLGKVLKKDGYNVVIASALDGSMREQMVADGIPVICDIRLKNKTLSDIEWANNFQLVWVNTVAMFYLLISHKQRMPVVWWIHESEMIYQEDLSASYNEMFSAPVDFRNVYIYGVSDIANIPFLKRWPKVDIVDILPLGVEDLCRDYNEPRCDSPFVFAVIGNICKRKAQDVFLSAIEMIPESIYRECEFWIIGACGSDEWAQSIYSRAETLDNVKLCGQFTRNQMTNALKRINAVVVPSREETFSIAAVEGMMYYTGVICTDEQCVGVSPYVREANAGLLVPKDNAKALADAIIWAVTHPKAWQDMGRRGRLLYEETFSTDVFSERVERCVRNLL